MNPYQIYLSVKFRKIIKSREDINEYNRKLYAKNPQPQIDRASNWNKNNRLQRNATKRARHLIIKDRINAKLREKRLLNRINGKVKWGGTRDDSGRKKA